MKTGLGVVLATAALIMLAGAAVKVRVTPVLPQAVHLATYPSGIGHKEAWNGHIFRKVQIGDGAAEMARFDTIIRATPRTKVLAGSVSEGMITYVTLSKWWRFPDTTTVERNKSLIEGGEDVISISGWSYYGKLDFGVNRKRIERWLIQMEVGG